MPKGYDNLALTEEALLDLPFFSGVGAASFDIARPHHPVMLNGPPTWGQVASGLTVINFDGAADYLDCTAATSGDLDFIAGAYSIAAWVNWVDAGNASIVIGRYGVDLDGWELYLELNGGIDYLTLRHHHASQAPDFRTGCFSVGWDRGQWWLLGITREEGYPLHYRNGAAIEVTYAAGGLLDPDTCNRDLVIGTRFTKDANWYEGAMFRPRVWDRALSAQEMLKLFEMERHLLGV